MDDFEELERLSLVSKVSSELQNYLGVADSTIAEFVIAEHEKHRDAPQAFKKSLEESYLREDYAGSSPVLGKRKAIAALTGDAKRRREESPEHEDSPLPVCSLFLPPAEARTPLRPEHIQDAFARMQTDWSQRRSAGMRNWRGGLVRTTVSLI